MKDKILGIEWLKLKIVVMFSRKLKILNEFLKNLDSLDKVF